MKILFHQPTTSKILNAIGAKNIYVKQLFFNKDYHSITKKNHFHCNFEIHFMVDGFQRYTVNGTSYDLTPGNMLVIPPNVAHKITEVSTDGNKYSLTFDIDKDLPIQTSFTRTHERLYSNLCFIEDTTHLPYCSYLKENTVCECICLLLKDCLKCVPHATSHTPSENTTLVLAKQFIKDNPTNQLKVADVARYCHISTRQLNRLFLESEGVTPKTYIEKQLCEYMKMLLKTSDITLSGLCEKLEFSSESYCSTFFKKNVGESPNAYRVTLGNQNNIH